MLPSSDSTQNFHSISTLGLPLPPRSISSVNLSSNGSATTTPSFLRSMTSPYGVTGASGAGGPSGSSHGSRDSPVPPLSPRIPSTPLLSIPSGGDPSSNAHGSYDARLVANTINKIESTSGLGAVSHSGAGSGSTPVTGATSGLQGNESDAWTAVCIRTLPLFNGEGQRGYIEDLNDLVSLHIKRGIERHGASPFLIASLTSELVDLLSMGMLTLNAKLSELSDDKLLIRITEVWNFFFIGCLPYIEGIFLPLRTETTLLHIAVLNNDKNIHGMANAGTKAIESIDIRRIALRSFRDHLVLPIVDKLAVLFSALPNASSTQPLEPSSIPQTNANVNATTRTASARRLQMVSLLTSIQTNDDRQSATEALGKALRAGMQRQPSYVASANSTGLNGLYGAGYYSSSAQGGKEAERKGWRKGRQIRPGQVAIIGKTTSQSGKDQDTILDGEDHKIERRIDHDGDEERRYLDQLRTLEQD